MNVTLQCLLAVLFSATALQAEPFHTSVAFRRQLSLPASIFWSEVPLRAAVIELSKTRRLATWLDRRCDPSQPISFAANFSTLRACLTAMAVQEPNLEAVWLDDVVYFGPSGAGNRLATMHEIHKQELAKLPPAAQARLRRKKPSDWARLTSPQTLVEQMETELGNSINNKDLVRHDLWYEHTLPDLPLFERLELVLVGFDLTFTMNRDGSVTIVPMPHSPRVTRPHKIPKDRLDAIQTVLKPYPNARLHNDQLTASWRVHELVEQLSLPKPAPSDRDQTLYTLRAKNQPVGSFLRSLCRQLSLECEFADVSQADLEQRITFEVKRAKLRKLFEEILVPVGMSFKLENDKLVVSKK